MTKKQPSISFFFSTIKYFENLIFRSLENVEPHVRICYLLKLKDRCQEEMDKIMLMGKEKEIFEYLDNIDNR